MSCFTVSVFHVFVLQRAFGSQMNSKLLYELWLILPKVLKEKRLLEGLCWLEIWRSNRVAHKKQILKEGNILKMVDIWISLAVGFVKLVTFTYDIITYLPFYLIEKPYYKLKISRRVKVSFQLHMFIMKALTALLLMLLYSISFVMCSWVLWNQYLE